MRENRETVLNAYYEQGQIDEKLANEILELQEMLSYGRKPKPRRQPRIKKPAGPPTWRKGPKPQFILDLEKEWAEAEAAEEAARARAHEEPGES